jgi:tetratricopeptide (TPR) repeat protein
MDAKVMQAVQEMLSQGRWADAYNLLYENSVHQDPDPLVEFHLGVISYNMGDYARAEAHLNKSNSIYPDNGDVHYQLGLSMLKAGRIPDSVPQFKLAVERKPNFAVGHLHYGITLLATGQLPEALEQFTNATKIAPNLGAGHYQAGLACLMMGQFPEALQHFQRAINVDPTLTEGFIGLGQTYTATGNLEEAVSAFGNAFSLEPDDTNLRKMWAASLMNAGRYDDAVRHYQEIINLGAHISARERAMAYNDWGVCLYRQQRLEEAAEKLVHAVDVDSALIEARINLGLLQLRLHEYELANETFEKVLAEQPANLQAMLYLAVTMLFAGKGKEALAGLMQLQKVNVTGPKPADLELWTGFASLSLGDVDMAGRSFEKVLQVEPRNYLALDGLGCCYAATDQHEQALERFGACLSVKRDFALGHMHAAKSLEAAGDPQAAKEEYELALKYDRDVLLPHKDALEILLQASEFNAVMTRSIKLLEIAPDDIDAKLALSKALKAENHADEALELLGRVLVEDPMNVTAHTLAGQIFMHQGRLVEADDMFRKASDDGNGSDADASLFYSWGKTLALLGLHELAIEKYQKASEIDPYDGDVYEAWGAVLKFLGRFGEAAEVYKRAADYL